jgi:hypothetical protein
MKRTAACLSILLFFSGLPTAMAAPGDGIAKACVGSFKARAIRSGREDKVYANRQALCDCLEARIKGEVNLSTATKESVRKFYIAHAKDPAAAKKLQLGVPKAEGKLIGVHANACLRKILPK